MYRGKGIRYLASIVAVRFSGKGMELDHLPITIEADDHDEADQKALEIALQRWPKSEGWSGHDAVAVLR